MISPRSIAVIFVLLLVAILSLACISPLALFNPTVTQGPGVEHADGKIVAIQQADMSFVLQTASGQRLRFLCVERCRLALQHMERHLREKAHTDVYYYPQTAGKPPIAFQVD
ncbi:hypothetical protein [Thermogemmatispora sp.]|jgi:hypothetical protein|uniref:hypothetical protein n=1 Tax=Thermogemmatispora sp. TaxID=1968838 RepID=UPI0035E4586F